jgi:hypothetical protein
MKQQVRRQEKSKPEQERNLRTEPEEINGENKTGSAQTGGENE